MIVVTGGEGFIGGNLVSELKRRGYSDIVVLDTKSQTLDSIYNWLAVNADKIECIFHLGAITDTTVMDRNIFDEYNVNCSIFIWNICVLNNIPLIYASSAATYGDGGFGFNDEDDIIILKPLNPYGWSKQQFDVWAETQEKQPPRWYGLKFFNVYGYNETHKGKMASVAFQLYNQLKETGKMRLFKSHNPNYDDGEQLRDFIYVDDVVDICIYMFQEGPKSGIYNVGTGKARSFNDVAKAVYLNYYDLNSLKSSSFEETAKKINKLFDFREKLIYFDVPNKLKDKYQYFTEATMTKLRNNGYSKSFHELEEGIKKYVEKLKNENFLKKD